MGGAAGAGADSAKASASAWSLLESSSQSAGSGGGFGIGGGGYLGVFFAAFFGVSCSAPAGEAYNTYLQQRKANQSSPAFYLDCADFFAKVDTGCATS